MLTLVAGVVSGSLAWIGNSWLLARFGEHRAVIWLVPPLEEAAKTLAAVVLGGSLVYTHLIFGALEGILDIRNGGEGLTAALYSVLTHSAFGAITAGTYLLTQSLFWAIVVAVAIHMGWNWRIMAL